MDIYPLIAERLRQDGSVIDEALQVLSRWEVQRVGPARRRAEWQELLLSAKAGDRGRQALIDLLLDSSEEARRRKDFAPFAGVLTREERREAFLGCSYDH